MLLHSAYILKELQDNTTSMKLKITNADWQTKKVKITNNTVRTLKNGVVIPTFLAMERKIKKIR